MIIYNKSPIDVLWDTVKSLADTIPIYKEGMDEDENSTPESYLILRGDVSSGVATFGDGSGQIRRSDCDLILVSKGVSGNATSTHNTNKASIEKALEDADIPYEGYNLGYVETLKCSEYTFSTTIYYRKKGEEECPNLEKL